MNMYVVNLAWLKRKLNKREEYLSLGPRNTDFGLLNIAWNKGLPLQIPYASWMWGYRRIQNTERYHTKNTLKNNKHENCHHRLDIEFPTDF